MSLEKGAKADTSSCFECAVFKGATSLMYCGFYAIAWTWSATCHQLNPTDQRTQELLLLYAVRCILTTNSLFFGVAGFPLINFHKLLPYSHGSETCLLYTSDAADE